MNFKYNSKTKNFINNIVEETKKIYIILYSGGNQNTNLMNGWIELINYLNNIFNCYFDKAPEFNWMVFSNIDKKRLLKPFYLIVHFAVKCVVQMWLFVLIKWQNRTDEIWDLNNYTEF